MKSRKLQDFIKEIQHVNRNPKDNSVLKLLDDVSTNPEIEIDADGYLYRSRIIGDKTSANKETAFYGYGEKDSCLAVITEDMRRRVIELLSINYEQYISMLAPQIAACQLLEAVDADLSYEWIGKYRLQCSQVASVLSITLEDYTFLWDETYKRVVAVYGISNAATGEKRRRDKPRIAYYFRNFIKRYQSETKMDTGHFIAHSLGGGLDMNLFPQKRVINRGYSTEGALYRKMENYALNTPGTFLFSRPIYFDNTWRPFFLEYCVLKGDSTLWTHIFDNI